MRYFIGLLITIGLIVLILFLLFSGGSAPKVKPLNLGDYAYSAATAELIIDGPIVAEQNHHEVKIDVSQNDVTLTVYQGYQQTLVRTQSYPNNESSFAVFLHSLQLNGFDVGNNDITMSDERGHCAPGERNIYTFNDGSKNLFRFWSTTCGSGTYKGIIGTTLFLFQQQVPDYAKLTSDTGL